MSKPDEYLKLVGLSLFIRSFGMLLATMAIVLALSGCDRDPAGISVQITSETNLDAQALTGRVTKYGLFEVLRTGPLLDNKQTNTGKTHSGSTIQLIEQTERIPLQKSNYFGFQSRIEPLPDRQSIEVKKVVRHPEMILPDGSRKSAYEVDEIKKVSSGVALMTAGYSLDEDYELVQGEWIFQYWFENKLLVEQKFVTYVPVAD